MGGKVGRGCIEGVANEQAPKKFQNKSKFDFLRPLRSRPSCSGKSTCLVIMRLIEQGLEVADTSEEEGYSTGRIQRKESESMSGYETTPFCGSILSAEVLNIEYRTWNVGIGSSHPNEESEAATLKVPQSLGTGI